MVLRTEAVLLREIVSGDPIETPDTEYGTASCHFCGSGERSGPYERRIHHHFHDCLWLEALALLDMPVPEDHIVGRPALIWLSTDASRKFPNNIRWRRFFKFV